MFGLQGMMDHDAMSHHVWIDLLSLVVRLRDGYSHATQPLDA